MDFTIQYNFLRLDGGKNTFNLVLDKETITLKQPSGEDPPDWALLDNQKCSNCDLQSSETTYCPAAVCLAPVIESFSGLASHDEVSVVVITGERQIRQKTTAQKGIGSLLGLIMAASGCNQTAFFRPMARFHLPFADEEETIYRAVSMYLLAQYFKKKGQLDVDEQLDGLSQIYKNIQEVNASISKRIREASQTDSSTNAVIVLDMYAKAMPYVIRDALSEIEYLFKPYLAGAIN